MGYSLLLVDDDAEILDINKKYFDQLGYSVSIASTAEIGRQLLSQQAFDCIVLDVMMPGEDGFSFCQWIKNNFDTPLIFLTGKTAEDDKINGLLLGGDDYIIKPYSLRELDARIQVLIRRYQKTSLQLPGILEFPPLKIDLLKQQVFYNNTEIILSKKEFDFLSLLVQHPNKIFTFEELGNTLWGGYLESDRKTIMVTASRLRKKMELHPGDSNCIETVWSKGYRFIPN